MPNYYIERQCRHHISRLNAWVQQVQNARRAEEALRFAISYAPSPSPLIRGMKSMYGSDHARAQGRIEAILCHRLSEVCEQKELVQCIRLAKRLTWARKVVAWAREAERSQRILAENRR